MIIKKMPVLFGSIGYRGLFVALLGCLIGPGVFAQSIVLDGGTSTSVSIDAFGKVTVGIAPKGLGAVSHNTYSSFSVTGVGVDLDNSVVQAETIVNEVTSGNISIIAGALTVIGPKAHVIIANPNGIQVDGGRFLNTGNVGLVTSTMAFDSAGRPVSTTSGGTITIGSQGLSGTMEELALVSANMALMGAISHDQTGVEAHTNIIAGNSTVIFDKSLGGGGILPWALTSGTGIPENGVVVDISEAGSIRSGRVSITVTNLGAGVRHEGVVAAGSGGFRLSSTGQISMLGSQITSEGSVNIKVGSASLASTTTSQAAITSQDSGVTLETTVADIELGDALISGKKVSSDNLSSSGGVTLISEGSISAVSTGNAVSQLASSEDSVVLIADGAVELDGTTIETLDDFRISTVASATLKDVSGEFGEDFRLLANSDVTFANAKINASSDIRIDGRNVQFGSAVENEGRSELVASNGGVVVKSSTADILNYGSLIQGSVRSPGDVTSLGGVTIISAGNLLNRSLSLDRLAVLFGQNDDLNISVAGDLVNETGRLFSNLGVVINAGGDLLNQTRMSGPVSPYSLNYSNGSRFASSLWLMRERITTGQADYGEQAVAGEISMILGVGDVSIAATNVTNIGGDISGRSVTIGASSQIKNSQVIAGSLEFSQVCRWFCRTSGYSTVRTFGGTVTASANLTLAATDSVYNLGGRFSAEDDLTIDAPLIESFEVVVPGVYERPAGLIGLSLGTSNWVVHTSSPGQFRSNSGEITFNGSTSLGETVIVAPAGTTFNGSIIKRTIVPPPSGIGRRPIGLFWNLF